MDITETLSNDVTTFSTPYNFVAKYFGLINIINQVKEKITDDSDMVWTIYDNAKQLRDELKAYMLQLQAGDISSMEKLEFLFGPTATLQEHAISNDWADDY